MSWFKKIVNRFFTVNEERDLNDENEDSKLKDKNDKLDIETENDLIENKERPAFRFPIITDAEIYGWEENPTEERVGPTVVSTDDLDDDFEPIPLYKNERWPEKDDELTTVYRVNNSSRLMNDRHDGDETGTNKYIANSYDENYEDTDYLSVPKTWGERFTPTTVASPIHGFTMPKKTVVREVGGDVRLVAEEQLPLVSEQEQKQSYHMVEGEDIVKSTEEEMSFTQDITEPTVAIKNTPSDVEENHHTNLLEGSSRNNGEALQVESEVDLVKDTQNEAKKDVSSQEQEGITLKEEKQPIEEQFIEPNAAASTKVSTTKEIEDALNLKHLNEEQRHKDVTIPEKELEEPKKERVVPFNVLMLKSDKEKLAKSLRVEQEQKLEVKSEVANNIRKQPDENSFEAKPLSEFKQEARIVEDLEGQHYVFPSVDYLIPPEKELKDHEWLDSQSEKLEESLSHFGIQANVIDAVQGPTVTRFELTVGQGTKVSRIRNLTDDLKLALAAKEIRIQAPIPGKSSIGIEIPNKQTRPVRISEVIETSEFKQSTSPLEAVLGLSLTGKPITLDLRKMPHGMIAGATGSGKSVCINSILVSLLYKANPTDLKLMLIDPKMVELAPFNGIPHLISPVITDVKAANAALKWAVAEMERRYELLAHTGVRDIERYNKVVEDEGKYSLKMPYLLIVIDELSDLMMMAPQDVEVSISRIAQKARACGIHLIIATQRPSVDVITGTIKANIPTRIAFSVSSQVDSRTIIDTAGAERLLGKGDMLYIGNGQSAAVRLQGTFVTDDEIERIIGHVQQEASPSYLFGQDELLKSAVEEEEQDPLFEETCLFVYEQGSASTSMLQRNFSIGYNRAAKLMDRMENRGYISKQRGSRPRDVYLTESDLEQLTK